MNYRLGDRINDLAPPAIEQPNAGGLIIEMPLDEVQQYLERVLSLGSIASDEQLIEHLDYVLSSTRTKPIRLPPLERLELSFRHS